MIQTAKRSGFYRQIFIFLFLQLLTVISCKKEGIQEKLLFKVS